MSAFFFCLHRQGQSLSEQEIAPMMACIEEFGVDDRQLVIQDDFAMGFQAFWTTPEEQYSRQPLFDKATGLWLLFHGRIDNRDALFARLGLSPDSTMSDVQLLWQFYLTFGESKLSQVTGPMSLVLFNQNTKHLIAFRDFTGARYLVYYLSDNYLIITNVATTILAHPKQQFTINEEFLIRKFAYIAPTKADTLVSGVEQVKPGHKIMLNKAGLDEHVFYLPDPKKRIILASDQAYYDEFKRLLSQSVQRRLRSTTLVGSMLSGGLDSVPMTILAAQQQPKDKKVQAFTWTFDQYPQTDEREFTSEIFEQYAIDANEINCDKAWFDIGDNPDVNPLQPFHTPYLAFLYKMYEKVQQKRIRVLLSGIGGDLLYCGEVTIIWELLLAGQFKACYQESKHRIKAIGGFKNFVKVYLIKPLRLYRWVRPWLASLKLIADGGPEWLTDDARADLDTNKHWLDTYANQALRPIQYRNLLGCLDANDAAGGRLLDIKYGFEKRHPFRDRDLIEFMLAIPSKYLFFAGEFRPIIKQAFQQELPKCIYQRNTKADFFPVIKHHILSSKRVNQYLTVSHSDWQRYVNKGYIYDEGKENTFQIMLKWNCAYYEAWKERCYPHGKITL